MFFVITRKYLSITRYCLTMRKVVITLDTAFVNKVVPSNFFATLDSMEAKALLKIDIQKGVKIAVCEIKMKNKYTLNDLTLPQEWKILDVLEEHKENTNVYTCLIKTQYTMDNPKVQHLFKSEEYAKFRHFFGLDIIFDLPFIIAEEKLVLSFTADTENMKKLLDNIKIIGRVKNISFQPAEFSEQNMLSCLTERQKEVITTAQKNGYYEVPRKVTTEELSKKLGISTATVLEHLRKAEKRIISNILAGY